MVSIPPIQDVRARESEGGKEVNIFNIACKLIELCSCKKKRCIICNTVTNLVERLQMRFTDAGPPTHLRTHG
jgi:hypothetical protein